MSLRFTAASTQYLYVNTAVATAVPLSMACWFNANNITSDGVLMCLVDKDVDTQYFDISARGAQTGDKVYAETRSSAGGSVNAVTSSGYTAAIWQHAAGVFSAINARAAYLNGGSKGTNTSSVTPANIDRTAIGALARSSLTLYFDGAIAEAAIWNVALSDTEIAILALGYSPKLISPSNLVFYAPLIRSANPGQDIKGGLSLTWNNTPAVEVHPRVFYTGR